MNALTAPAKIQALIKTINPAKITPALRGLIAAHMIGWEESADLASPADDQDKPATRRARIAAILSDGVPRKVKEVATQSGYPSGKVQNDLSVMVKKGVLHKGRKIGTSARLYSNQPFEVATTARDAQILSMYRSGLLTNAIAEKFGITRDAVATVISRQATAKDRQRAVAARYNRSAKAKLAPIVEART